MGAQFILKAAHQGTLTLSLIGVDGRIDRQVVRCIGYRNPWDGGGGGYEFRLGDTTTANGYTVLDAPGGRWHMIFEEPGRLDLRRFGMHPSESAANNAAGLNAAIAAAKEGWQLLLPTYGYSVSESTYNVEGNFSLDVAGLSLVSNTATARNSEVFARLSWADEGWLSIDASNVQLHAINLFAAASCTTEALIKWDSLTTNFVMHGVRISQAVGADVEHGLQIGETVMQNCEHGVFVDCAFVTASALAGASCVRIGGSNSGQSKRHIFQGCYFAGYNQGSGSGRSMIGINCYSGSFEIWGGAATNLERIVNLVYPSDPIAVRGFDSEGHKRVLDWASGDAVPTAKGVSAPISYIAGNAVPILFYGGRYSADGVDVASNTLGASDDLVFWSQQGELTLDGLSLTSSASPDAGIIKTFYGPLRVTGCRLPSRDCFQQRERITAFANTCPLAAPYSDDVSGYYDGPSLAERLSYHQPSDGRPWRPLLINSLAPHGITSADSVIGDLANAVVSKNLRGSITISDTATEGAVTFTRAEGDANYDVQLTIVHTSASSAAAGASVKYGTLATSGFTIKLDTAPGTGETCKINWMILR